MTIQACIQKNVSSTSTHSWESKEKMSRPRLGTDSEEFKTLFESKPVTLGEVWLRPRKTVQK